MEKQELSSMTDANASTIEKLKEAASMLMI